MNPLKLFKDLQREIRCAEKQVIALNPPKPERESKRRKKKVLADDFIDYTNLTSFNNVLEERLPDRKVKVLKVNSPQVSFSYCMTIKPAVHLLCGLNKSAYSTVMQWG